jgi:acyl-coenzyme A thioesterase PaaI-like protein
VSAGESGLQQPLGESGLSLQERYAPNSICFGCGPANAGGLHIRSFPAAATGGVEGDPSDGADEVIAEWMPTSGYEAFPGVLNGGIIGALLDCHSNWTAAYHLMRKAGAEKPPTTVTSDYAIKLLRPTPADQSVHLRARVVESTDRRAVVEATLESGGEPSATCRGTFVAVREGHTAYNRW